MVQDEINVNVGKQYNVKKKAETAYFVKIPPELWSYIYGFCMKNEFQRIKMCCNGMAVIALQEMNKY